MPGAGKSVVVNVARVSDYGVVVMDDIVMDEAKRRRRILYWLVFIILA